MDESGAGSRRPAGSLSGTLHPYEVPCKRAQTNEILDGTAEVRRRDGRARLGLHPQASEQIAVALCTPALGVRELGQLLDRGHLRGPALRPQRNRLGTEKAARVGPAAVEDVP